MAAAAVRLAVLAAAMAPCAGWTVFAGGGSAAGDIDLTNVTTAMASAYRFSYRRPFLRWAMDPTFCGAMHNLLIEEQSSTLILAERWQNFTRCERIRGLIRQAFDTWSAANPALHFIDVTDRCEAERLWVPVEDSRCAESQHCIDIENATTVDWKAEQTPLEQMPSPPADLCTLRTCFECARADVMVGGFSQKNRRLGDQHAAARVMRPRLTDARPLAPDGEPALGKTVFKASLEFNVDDEYKNVDTDSNCWLGSNCNATMVNCWRLDDDVCDWVIALPFGNHPAEVQSAIATIFWVIFSLIICSCLMIVLSLLQRLAANLLTGWDVDRDGKLEMQEIVYVLDEFCGEVCFECRCPQVHQKKMTKLSGALSVLETLSQQAIILPIFIFTCMISLGVLYVDAVMPCYSCRDFRASAVHEIGHLLSLDHPTGVDGAIPMVFEPTPPAPAPPPPAAPPAAAGDELVAVEPTYRPSNWSAYEFQCFRPWQGVMIDPAATLMLSPPPPPMPPPAIPPSPLMPNATWPPPPALPPTNMTANITIVLPPPPVNVSDNSHEGKMGTSIDAMNESVMVAFGSTGFHQRPIAGVARRCLSQDDLDGLNFLYPWCGTMLKTPPCDVVLDDRLVGLRLFESWLKLMILPVCIIAGAKLLALLLLFAEDVVASYQVRREARRLLNEAEAAEKERKEREEADRVAAGEELPADEAHASSSPKRRLGFSLSPSRAASGLGESVRNLSPFRRKASAGYPSGTST